MQALKQANGTQADHCRRLWTRKPHGFPGLSAPERTGRDRVAEARGKGRQRGHGRRLAFRFRCGQRCPMDRIEASSRKGRNVATLGRAAAFLWLIASLLLASAPGHGRISTDAAPIVLSSSANIPAILRADSATTYLAEARKLSVWARESVRKYPADLAGGAAYPGPPTWTAGGSRQEIRRDFDSPRQAGQRNYRYFDPQGPPRLH